MQPFDLLNVKETPSHFATTNKKYNVHSTTESPFIPSNKYNVFEVLEPVKKVVGEKAVIQCMTNGLDAANNLSRSSWTRVDGRPMPSGYRIESTQLFLPHVEHENAGKYKCVVEDFQGREFVSVINLKVGDYVPHFNGDKVIDIEPLTQEQWHSLDLKLSIKPETMNGVIFHAENFFGDDAETDVINSIKNNSHVFFHTISLHNGKVRYEFNVGNGKTESLETSGRVETGKWSEVYVINNLTQDSLVSLQNNDDALVTLTKEEFLTEKNYSSKKNEEFDADDELKTFRIYLGGIGNDAQVHGLQVNAPSFKGSINRVLINNKKIDIGGSLITAQNEMSFSKTANKCYIEPCLNGGECIPAYRHLGYRCECPKQFQGQFCQFRSKVCSSGAECKVGFCVSHPNWEKCVCPLNRSGRLCELFSVPSNRTQTAFCFNGKTSFISLLTSKIYLANTLSTHKLFQFQLNFITNNTQRGQLIALAGVNLEKKNTLAPFFALTIENGLLFAVHSETASGQKPLKREQVIANVLPNQIYTLKVYQKAVDLHVYVELNNRVARIPVNNPIFALFPLRESALTNVSSSFNFFIGGYAMGLEPSRTFFSTFSHVGNNSQPFFAGCFSNIVINEKIIDINDRNVTKMDGFLSGDLEAYEDFNPLTTLLYLTELLSTTTEKSTLNRSANQIISMMEIERTKYSNIINSTTTVLPITQKDMRFGSNEAILPTSTYVEEVVELSTTYLPSTTTVSPPPLVIDSMSGEILETSANNLYSTISVALKPTTKTISTSTLTTLFQIPKMFENVKPFSTLPLLKIVSLELSTTTTTTTTIAESTAIKPVIVKPSKTVTMKLETTQKSALLKEKQKLFGLFVGLCNAKTCGKHGDCNEFNVTHVFCSCRDYYVGMICDEFRSIEYAAQFDGNAFIVFSADEFPHLTSEKEEFVTFRLKTRADNGIIFWQGQQPESTIFGEDYVSISVSEGFLIFSYELGGGAAHLVSSTKINDGRVHLVRAGRKGRKSKLIIDKQPPIYGTSSGILAMLNVEGNIYIGGLPNLSLMTAGLHTYNFVGCIAEIALNNQKLDIMTSAIDGQNVRPCESWHYYRRKSKLKRKIFS